LQDPVIALLGAVAVAIITTAAQFAHCIIENNTEQRRSGTPIAGFLRTLNS
jgi:hypothetical protein